MSSTTGAAPVIARFATLGDAEELVRLRALMFGAMGIATTARGWEQTCLEDFRDRIESDCFIVAVVDAPSGGGLAASGIAEVISRIPGPTSDKRERAYISTMCTDPRWRRRGMALAVISLLMRAAGERGVSRFELHASNEGRPLYESLGFRARDIPSVEMWLEP
jgi:GNAT superfamily N-acetyltransferase